MEVKLKVTPMRRADIPSIHGGSAGCLRDQYTGILRDFEASDSECISLLSGEPCDRSIPRNIASQVRNCIAAHGFEGLKVVERVKSNNVYVVKEA